jgi:hypothetical protein
LIIDIIDAIDYWHWHYWYYDIDIFLHYYWYYYYWLADIIDAYYWCHYWYVCHYAFVDYFMMPLRIDIAIIDIDYFIDTLFTFSLLMPDYHWFLRLYWCHWLLPLFHFIDYSLLLTLRCHYISCHWYYWLLHYCHYWYCIWHYYAIIFIIVIIDTLPLLIT